MFIKHTLKNIRLEANISIHFVICISFVEEVMANYKFCYFK